MCRGRLQQLSAVREQYPGRGLLMMNRENKSGWFETRGLLDLLFVCANNFRYTPNNHQRFFRFSLARAKNGKSGSHFFFVFKEESSEEQHSEALSLSTSEHDNIPVQLEKEQAFFPLLFLIILGGYFGLRCTTNVVAQLGSMFHLISVKITIMLTIDTVTWQAFPTACNEL